MQKDEVLEFLRKVDAHLDKTWGNTLGGDQVDLRIFGKSALLIAGLQDSVGTADIDLLKMEGSPPTSAPKIIADLEREFGKERRAVHGYYL